MRKLLFILLVMAVFLSVTPVRAGEFFLITASGQRLGTDPYALIAEVNALRAAKGLPAYLANSILMLVAQQQAEYMAATGSVTHYGPGGLLPWQRGLAAGYPLAGDLSQGGFYSENIIAGNKMSVQEAVIAWQGDAPHLNTMLSPNLQEIGAGVAFAGDTVYYAIDCASPRKSGLPPTFTPRPGVTQLVTATPGTPPNTGIPEVVVKTISPNTPSNDGKLYHVVQKGETLWLIAISYGVKVANLRRLNNLAETQDIFPGNKLLIREAYTPSPVPPTATATPYPTITRLPTWTALPSPTSTPRPIAPVAADSSKLVLAAIVGAALVLAAIFVRAGRKL